MNTIKFILNIGKVIELITALFELLKKYQEYHRKQNETASIDNFKLINTSLDKLLENKIEILKQQLNIKD